MAERRHFLPWISGGLFFRRNHPVVDEMKALTSTGGSIHGYSPAFGNRDRTHAAITSAAASRAPSGSRKVADRDKLMQSRRQVRGMVQKALVACRAPGRAAVPAVTAARAITTMCVAVAGWYVPGGTPTPQEIAHEYIVLALGMVDAAPVSEPIGTMRRR